MDSTIKALIVKKFKDAELELGIGRHNVDESFVVRVVGSVEKHVSKCWQMWLYLSRGGLEPLTG